MAIWVITAIVSLALILFALYSYDLLGPYFGATVFYIGIVGLWYSEKNLGPVGR